MVPGTVLYGSYIHKNGARHRFLSRVVVKQQSDNPRVHALGALAGPAGVKTYLKWCQAPFCMAVIFVKMVPGTVFYPV